MLDLKSLVVCLFVCLVSWFPYDKEASFNAPASRDKIATTIDRKLRDSSAAFVSLKSWGLVFGSLAPEATRDKTKRLACKDYDGEKEGEIERGRGRDRDSDRKQVVEIEAPSSLISCKPTSELVNFHCRITT